MNVSTALGNCSLGRIDSYGSHKGVYQGIKGRLSCWLHKCIEYKQKNLAQYYVEWVQENKSVDSQEIPKGFEVFFKSLGMLKEEKGVDFDKANSRHIACITKAFEGEDNEENLKRVFAAYNKLTEILKGDFNIEVFIEAAKKVLEQTSSGDLEPHMKANFLAASPVGMFDGIVWEIACAFWGYRYEAWPIIGAYLNAIPGSSLLFSSFWEFFVVATLAEFTTLTIGAGIKGVYDKGSLREGIKAMVENWNQRIADENSFHPVVDTLLASLWITVSWLYIDKIQKAAKAGDLLFKLMQWGIKDFVFKYVAIDVYFALKAELHKENFNSENVTKGLLRGMLRGAIKNPLAAGSDYVQSVFKLSQALSLMKYEVPGKEEYLKFWLASVPQVGFDCFKSLITVLWLAKDAWEVLIVNLSGFYADMLLFAYNNHMALKKNVSEYWGTLLLSICAGYWMYHDKEVYKEFLSVENPVCLDSSLLIKNILSLFMVIAVRCNVYEY